MNLEPLDFCHDGPFDLNDPKMGGWAAVEIMGHRSHLGFVREVTLFGAAMLEVAIPFHDKPGVQHRHVYGGSSVFSLTPMAKDYCVERAPRDWAVASLEAARSLDDGDDEPRDVDEEPQ